MHTINLEQAEFVREQESLVKDITVKFKDERGEMQGIQDLLRSRIMRLETQLRKFEGCTCKREDKIV